MVRTRRKAEVSDRLLFGSKLDTESYWLLIFAKKKERKLLATMTTVFFGAGTSITSVLHAN
jgi:hypothetical protein